MLCVFCEKFKNVGRNIIDIEPLNPVTPGHRLVIHKTHTKDFSEDGEVFADLAMYASSLAKDIGGDFNLITSKGINATQTVFHTHIHLVPRHEGDGLMLPWSKPSPEEDQE